MSNNDNKINPSRRNLLKIAGALGGGYVLGRLFPEKKNLEQATLNNVADVAFANSIDKAYYRSAQVYQVDFPKLAQDGDYDVCIIGGGLTGISTALHLANQNHKVILLEAGTLAAKASGVNGGQVSNSYECEMAFFEEKFGDEIAKKFWDLSLEAVNIVKSNIAKYKINCGWQSGIGIAAYKAEHLADLEEELEIISNKYGYKDIQLFDAKQAQELTGSSIYHGLLYDKGNGHMNPLNYALGLAQVLKNTPNISIFENSPATTIEFHEDKPHTIIVNDKYKISAKNVVLAANYGNDKFLPDLQSTSMSMETFIMATERLDDKIVNSLLTNRMAVFDTRRVMNYFRLTEGNNLLFGGGDVFGQFNLKTVEQTLYRELIFTYPQLAGVKVQNFWQGTESFTLNLAPVIGRTHANSVYYAKAYSGQGLALSNLTGKMFADAINGNSTNLDLFAQIKPFGFTKSKFIQDMTLKAGTYYYKILDKLS